jgi:hypothetical protein
MHKRLLAAILAMGVALSPLAAQDGTGPDLPAPQTMQATAAYNQAATELIIGYINAISGQELTALLNRLSEDPSAYRDMRDDLAAAIGRARKAVTALDVKAEALPEPPEAYLPRLRPQRDALGPYIEELGSLARRQLDTWDRQMAALDRGDVAAYDALIGEEMDTVVVLLQGEIALAQVQQSAVGPRQPQHGLLESIVAQNETLIAFLRMIPAVARGDGDAVDTFFGDVTSGVARMRDSIETTSGLIAATCRDPEALGVPRQVAAARRLCSDLTAANEAEGDILAVMEEYEAIAGLIRQGRLDPPTIERLARAETRLVPLIDRRTAIQGRIVESGLALTEALR